MKEPPGGARVTVPVPLVVSVSVTCGLGLALGLGLGEEHGAAIVTAVATVWSSLVAETLAAPQVFPAV